MLYVENFTQKSYVDIFKKEQSTMKSKEHINKDAPKYRNNFTTLWNDWMKEDLPTHHFVLCLLSYRIHPILGGKQAMQSEPIEK